MENNSNTLFGFEAITDVFSNESSYNPLLDGGMEDELTDEELERLQKSSPKKGTGNRATKTEELEEEEEELEDETEEEVEEEKPAKKESKVKPKEKKSKEVEEEEEADEDDTDDTVETDDEDEEKSTAVTALFDAIAEELGWDFEEDEEKPTSVEGLVEYFKNVIQENSTPEYASDEVAELDEFVRNGGKLEDYFSITPDIDFDNFDTTVESNQKQIVRMLLTEKGFNEKQIARKIEKYEDAGILEDEAEDALESMKEIEQTKKEQLLEQQKKQNQQMIENQQKFVDSVVGEIKGLNDIRGIKIPEKDRKELLAYIFKADANGVTQYQKDFRKSVKNLIESAYFTMKGDTLLSTAKKMGTSSAMKNLKQSLKSTGAGKGTKRINTTSSDSTFSRLVQLF